MKRGKGLIAFLVLIITVMSFKTDASASVFSTKYLTMNISETYDIPQVGSQTQSYKSSNTNIVTVTDQGKIKAVAAGSATVTAQYGNIRKYYKVSVKKNSLSISTSNLKLYLNDSQRSVSQIKATVAGASKNAAWSSSNTSVATVGPTGRVYAKGEGSAIITATANGISKSCNVTVIPTVLDFALYDIAITSKGSDNNYTLVPYVSGYSKNIQWKSSNTKIATVSSGKIVGKSEGIAVVTATANGITKEINVTVYNSGRVSRPTLELDKTYISLNSKGSNNQSTVTARVSGKSKSVKWASSDTKVATVSSGVIKGKAEGTAVISATANGITEYCTVEIINTSIQMPKTAELNALETESIILTPVVSGTDSNVAWKSSNTAIATVDNGVVKAVGHGKATITATANNISATCAVTVNKPSVELNSNNVCLYTGKGTGSSSTLKAKLVGNTKTVSWNSSNPEVASVNKNGKIDAVSEGSAVITATANGTSSTCNVEVLKTAISLDVNELTLTKDYFRHSLPIVATVTGYNKTVTWKSSNTKVAKVVKGEVTAVSEGRAVISATANGVTETCIVDVIDTLDEESIVSIDRTRCVLVYNSSVNNTISLNACIVGPTNDTTWTSSDKSVATVDGNGKVTAKKTGTATITVTSNGKSAICTVMVKEKKISLDKSSIVLNAYGNNISDEITATVINPGEESEEFVEYDEITWTSSNTSIATVDEDGHVVAIKGGTCNITAETSGVKAVCKVTVLENTIRLNAADISLDKDQAGKDTYRLTATVTGTAKDVTWETSDYTVAAVDENGLVTAVNPGECIISATANGETAICRVFVAGEAHVHNFVHESYSDVENVCMDSCTETLRCEECGAVKTVVIPAKGEHEYKLDSKVPTCETKGYEKFVCKICGHEEETTEIPAKSHKESDWIVDREATCSMAGAKHKKCTVCQKTIAEGEIPVVAHEYEAYGTTSPENPCTENTYAVMKCKNCDESYVDEGNIVRYAAHDYEWITEDATETSVGRRYEKCKVCNETGTETEIPKKDHVHVLEEEIIEEATCARVGSKRIYCKNCDYSVEESIGRKSHKFGSPVLTKEATCSETGMMESKCVCGFIWYTKIAKTGTHDYEHYSYSTVSDPCVDAVVETFKCKNCTATYTEDILPPGHSYITVTVREADYEHAGLKHQECSKCGKVKPGSDEEIPKLEAKECQHTSYTRTLDTPATCTNYATYKKTCNSCGVVIGTVEGTTLGEHGELIKKQTVAPTVNCEGEYSYICSKCGKTVKTESIPKLTTCPHTGYDYTVDLGDGKTGVYCCSCNTLLRIETSGNICTHKTTKQIMNTPPTSTTNGIVDVVCAECGKKISTQTIHYYSTYTVDIGNGQTETVCGYFDDSKAQEVYNLLNQYRVEKGLHTLQWASKLESETRTRTVESAYLFSHQRPNGQKWWCLNSAYMNGENLAAGYISPTSVMTGWKQSPGHDENMCYSSFYSVNVKCFCKLNFGTDPNRLTPTSQSYFWTQEFSCYTSW